MYRQLLAGPAIMLLAVGCTDLSEPAAPTLTKLPADPDAGVTLTAPVFDLATSPNGALFAAELRGVSEIRNGNVRVMAALADVQGVAALGAGEVFAVTGLPNSPEAEATAQKLYRVSNGRVRLVADLFAFEATVNPDQFWNDDAPDSNPFNLALLQGATVLVADAGANSILIVDEKGHVDWVAVLTPQLASTANFKSLIGCAPGDTAGPCGMPEQILAQPVATSIAIGPDGAWYAGELTGFPDAPGMSRIWRIAPGSRHVICPSSACTMVASGLRSIVDMAFGPDGTLYVVEFDAAGWLAVEIDGFPIRPVEGGRVKACSVATGSCTVIADGLALPSGITVTRDGTIWIAENELIPLGLARVRAIN